MCSQAKQKFPTKRREYDAPGGTRTRNFFLRTELLYPIELRAHNVHSITQTVETTQTIVDISVWIIRSIHMCFYTTCKTCEGSRVYPQVRLWSQHGLCISTFDCG